MIHILYTAVDGARISRSFKTLKGAKSFAHKWVGAYPEMGSHYAVSGDGIGKVQATGVSLDELFPLKTTIRDEPEMDSEQAAYESNRKLDEEAYYRAKAEGYAPKPRREGCTCSDQQLALVGCDCPDAFPF